MKFNMGGMAFSPSKSCVVAPAREDARLPSKGY